MAKIKIRRGAFADLPVLELGEVGYCTDTKQYYIGNGISNTWIAAPVLDEDAMTSDSDTSLATQQSIKKYVDDTSLTVWSGTQSEYDALGSYDSGTLYLIV